MKAALYALRRRENWACLMTIDLETDLSWWTQRSDSDAEELLLLAREIPLGWAVALRGEMRHDPRMDKYSLADWTDWLEKSMAKLSIQNNRDPLKGRTQQFPGRSITLSEERQPEVNVMERFQPGWLWARTQGYSSYAADLLAASEGTRPPSWEAAREAAGQLARALQGRSLLLPELKQQLESRLPQLAGGWRPIAQLAQLLGGVAFTAGVAPAVRRSLLRRGQPARCRRCGSAARAWAPCGSCGSSACAYCEACLALGRSRECALLVRGAPVLAAGNRAAVVASPTRVQLDRWGLSPAQRGAAEAALRFLAERPVGGGRSAGGRRRSEAPPHSPLAVPIGTSQRSGKPHRDSKPPKFLLWAVTGAGKTEMIFPLLQRVLDAGGRALVATPRRDVVLELAPRIAKVFPSEPPAVLYGGSTQRWEESRLVLATTHQLLRYHRAFDLVIIDELDAFPYHNDPMLAYAAENCCKPDGKFILLSATPPKPLQREAASGKIPHAKVPARFHGHPLPVPRHIQTDPLKSCLAKHRLPVGLVKELRRSVSRGAQIFLFVSRIRHIEPLVRLLRGLLGSSIPVEGTSSRDGERADKVLAFRSGEIRVLITTTILERGVTVPRSDVFILDADSGLFDEASLVQMAGRAGRSKDDPDGNVRFASPEWTASQRGAIRQIRQMNRLARRSGYLHAHTGKGR